MSAAAPSERRAPPVRRTIDEVLQSARGRIARLTPTQAKNDWHAGAVVVDIRPAAQREAHGALPGALVIERNVLEWRFDPASDTRLPIADYDLEVSTAASVGNRAPPHGGGASGGVLPLRATTTAADSKRDARAAHKAVICQEGYTSSLAAASLQDLGIHRATDVIGGYAAWRELL